jgi:hypothetical protein
MSSGKSQRKRLLVNRPYQVRFMVEIVAVVLVATLLSTGVAYFVTQKEVESGFFSGHKKLVNLHEALPKVLLTSALVTLLTMAFMGAYITLRETHRVIGPVRRMEEKFQQMTVGDFTYMASFRTGDVLKGLDDSINLHINNLGDLVQIMDMRLKDVHQGLLTLERGEGDREEILENIRIRLAEIDQYADAFRPS